MRLRQPRLLLAAAVLAAGCSSDAESSPDTARVVQIGAPGETNRVLSPEEVAELDAPAYNDADIDFVQGMIHHHQQALTMIALVDTRTERTDVPLLAERMDVSQTDEIARLESWLTERGQTVPDDHVHHEGATMMPGMLTEQELAELGAASGRAFDELFLQYMIRHHEGALVMIQQLFDEGVGAQEPAVFQMVQDMNGDQAIEISRMKQLLAEIAAGR